MAGLGDSVSPLQAKPQMGDKEVRELSVLPCLTLPSRVPTPGATHLEELTRLSSQDREKQMQHEPTIKARWTRAATHSSPWSWAVQGTSHLSCSEDRRAECPRDHPPLSGLVFERFWVPQWKTQNPETRLSFFHPTQHTTCQQARGHTKKPTQRPGPGARLQCGGFLWTEDPGAFQLTEVLRAMGSNWDSSAFEVCHPRGREVEREVVVKVGRGYRL